jgi:ABC-type transport system involved in multi-copper enzyme maturation permease subunit
MKILALVRYTFRELIARATLVVLAAISTLVLLFAFAAFSTATTAEGTIVQFFGNQVSPPLAGEMLDQFVAQMQSGFSGGLFLGVVLFGVLATAGAVPDMLERGTVDLYLAKPLARWQLLAGKFLGAVAVVFVNILYFIGVLWLISGLRLGVWNASFLSSAFLLTLVFACLYAVIVLTAVLTRTTAVAVLVAFLTIVLVEPVIAGRETSLFLLSDSPVYRGILDGIAWILPQLSGARDAVAQHIVHQPVAWGPVLQCVGSGAGFLALAAWVFHRRDY